MNQSCHCFLTNGLQFCCAFLLGLYDSSYGKIAPSPSLLPAAAEFHWEVWWLSIFDLRAFGDCFYSDGRNFKMETSFWRGGGKRWRWASMPKDHQRFRSSPLGRSFLAHHLLAFLATDSRVVSRLCWTWYPSQPWTSLALYTQSDLQQWVRFEPYSIARELKNT